MHLLRLLGFLTLFLCLPYALANAPSSPPDPSNLEADWWDYFVATAEDEPDTVASRIDTAINQLNDLRATFNPETQTNLAALTDSLTNSLAR